MKVTNVEKKEKSVVALTIQVDAEAFEAAVQAAYLKNRSKLSVPGFRRGKAPRKILEGMYCTGVFYSWLWFPCGPRPLSASTRS